MKSSVLFFMAQGLSKQGNIGGNLQFQPSCHTDMLWPLRLKWLWSWWAKLSGPRIMWTRPLATWPFAGGGACPIDTHHAFIYKGHTAPLNRWQAYIYIILIIIVVKIISIIIISSTILFWCKSPTTEWMLHFAQVQLVGIWNIYLGGIGISPSHLHDKLRTTCRPLASQTIPELAEAKAIATEGRLGWDVLHLCATSCKPSQHHSFIPTFVFHKGAVELQSNGAPLNTTFQLLNVNLAISD